MVSLVSAFPSFDSPYDKQADAGKTQAPQQTAAEQMKQLEQQGQSANQISEALGLPLSQVQSDLGLTTTTTTASVVPLSIKA